MQKLVISIYLIMLSNLIAAATLDVDTLIDLVDVNPGDGVCLTKAGTCSLRAAVQEANQLTGADQINLAAGQYQLGLTGMDEDLSVTGDLDVFDELTIVGDDLNTTIIDGVGITRILELHATHLAVSNVSFIGGKTNDIGGAIRVHPQSLVNIDHVMFKNNAAESGAAIGNEGQVVADFVHFIENHGEASAGAVFNLDDAEAGVVRQVTMVLSHCLIRGNSGSFGGAVESRKLHSEPIEAINASFDQCAIIDNSSVNTGVILNNGQTNMTINNTTISGNMTDGAVFNDGFSVLRINQSTIVNNSHIGLIDVHGGDQAVFMSNTVIAGNGGIGNFINCTTFLTSLGGNYFGDLGGCMPTFHGSDIMGSDDSGLSPLIQGAEPWQTVHYPLAGSPLIDAGFNDLCLAHDQVGVARPQDNDFDGMQNCTIGASENSEVIFSNRFE